MVRIGTTQGDETSVERLPVSTDVDDALEDEEDLLLDQPEQQSQQQQPEEELTEELRQHHMELSAKVQDAMRKGGWRNFKFGRHSATCRIVSIQYHTTDAGQKEVIGGSCTCQSLIYKGYLCRHLFRCLSHLQIHHVHPCFLDSRWRRLDPSRSLSSHPPSDEQEENLQDRSGGASLSTQLPRMLTFSLPAMESEEVEAMSEAFLHTTKDLAFQVAKMILDQHGEGKLTAEDARSRMGDFQSILTSLLHSNGEHLPVMKRLLQARDTAACIERDLVQGGGSGERRSDESPDVLTNDSLTFFDDDFVRNPSRLGFDDGGTASRRRNGDTMSGGNRKGKQGGGGGGGGGQAKKTSGNSSSKRGGGKGNAKRVREEDEEGGGGGRGGGGGGGRGGGGGGGRGSTRGRGKTAKGGRGRGGVQQRNVGHIPPPTDDPSYHWSHNPHHQYANPQHVFHTFPSSNLPYPGTALPTYVHQQQHQQQVMSQHHQHHYMSQEHQPYLSQQQYQYMSQDQEAQDSQVPELLESMVVRISRRQKLDDGVENP